MVYTFNITLFRGTFQNKPGMNVWLMVTLLLFTHGKDAYLSEECPNEFNDVCTTDMPKTLILGNLQLTLSEKLLLDITAPSRSILQGYLGWPPSNHYVSYEECKKNDSLEVDICVQYSSSNSEGKVMISEIYPNCNSVTCYNIVWDSHSSGFEDCYILGEHQWYGGGEVYRQRWPLQNESRPMSAYLTGDFFHHLYGGVIENLWVNSGGFAIYVEQLTPLFISFNNSGDGNFCLSTFQHQYPYEINSFKKLAYTICEGQNVKDVFNCVSEMHIKKPQDIPDDQMIKYPIWSTWARYKKNISQSKVLEYAKEIKYKGFSASQLQIDDDWESCYGELDFNKIKFPRPYDMVKQLKGMGYRITLWVHPFANFECNIFKEGSQKQYWVKNLYGKPLSVKWWNGNGGYLDVTNEDARKWFITRLKVLQKNYGIDSFKFDAGEVAWLSENFVFHSKDLHMVPNAFSQLYAEMASNLGKAVEVRVGYNSQHLPLFIRMLDKMSSWDYNNGLKTLIPTAFLFSLSGYPYILPDMIGGNNYGDKDLPDRELFIRWIQVNAFFPCMQFSVAPWDYDDNVTNIARTMVELHNKYSGYFLKLAAEGINSTNPIIRPLWWLMPEDHVALTIDSEFLVGNDILVAPILEQGAQHRNIYLPEGQWMDKLRGKSLVGPQWLYKYKVTLNEIPYFVRL